MFFNDKIHNSFNILLDQLLIYHLKALFMLFHFNYGKLVKSTYGGGVSLDVLTWLIISLKKIVTD